jgi:hypothetical protein
VYNTGIGTEPPLRWKSTAFNVNYRVSTLRLYFDNPKGLRSAWVIPAPAIIGSLSAAGMSLGPGTIQQPSFPRALPQQESHSVGIARHGELSSFAPYFYDGCFARKCRATLDG